MKEVLELRRQMLGTHIRTACETAVGLASLRDCPVHFKFNGTDVVVQPGERPGDVIARWELDGRAAHQEFNSAGEYRQREAMRFEMNAAREARMVERARTREEMSCAEVPWPLSAAQLAEYIDSLVNRYHSYETCVYAMSMGAEAAYNYVAGRLGATGFQASCADMDFMRRTRGIEGPWMFLKCEDALYPQYDLHKRVEEMLLEAAPWLKEQAEKKLSEGNDASPEVIRHWEKLAGKRS